MFKRYKDCYAEFDERIFTIGNSCIERKIELMENIPVSRQTVSKKDNKLWSGKSSTAMFNTVKFDYKNSRVFFHTYDEETGGYGGRALFAELIFKGKETVIKQIFHIFPETNAISYGLYVKSKAEKPSETDDAERNTAVERDKEDESANIDFPVINSVDTINIYEKNIKLDCIKLYDNTDINNELCTRHEELLYTKFGKSFSGNIFILKDYLNGQALLIARDSFINGFDKDAADFYINPISHAAAAGNGMIYRYYDDYIYCGGTTVVCGNENDILSNYKQFYKRMFCPSHTYIMSNTWGDRSRDKAVCTDFVRREIECAADIGADAVQIDDGWQKGISANSVLSSGGAWGNFYASDNDFWAVNSNKFPNGLLPLAQYAKQKGIRLGLWFSLDKTNSYEQWQRDADKILELYKKYDISFFKIDGLIISDPICENNIEKFIKYTEEKSCGRIELNMDITANRRFGYLLMKQYSVIFTENRYTDWGNYYPHTTLRNLWNLAGFFPASKFQFEVLNQKRNENIYGVSDKLRPSVYSIDYIFASVMVSYPLLWMEMSGLDEEQIKQLRNIISVYKKEREKICGGEVIPIGNCPDGISYTGFRIVSKTEAGIWFCSENFVRMIALYITYRQPAK
ncbi:MAG: alpha-galactosidase [Clostridia bacterium]|nr:alpha-galactosidase [Clostridia bacterium]